MSEGFTPYSTLGAFKVEQKTIFPEADRDRIGAYFKYDEMYWNDDQQFTLRVLEGEEPLYIPNARTIVDTTSHYLLKGLQVHPETPEKSGPLNDALKNFLIRERFYSRFHVAKHAGVARGDFAFHLTADPSKPAGVRISLTPLDPATVIPVYDDDDSTKLLKVHIVEAYLDPSDPTKQRIRKLTYDYELIGGRKRVFREEAIWELDPNWWGPKPKRVKTIIDRAPLSEKITAIPVYWFKNIDWEGQQFGSSELRGFERLNYAVSQAATDQEVALSLEGLGVYATDGGRPVDDNGNETDWEIAPGKVMEVPQGSFFRRVEGLSSMKPSMDHINYLESKLREAGGLSDVALGRVDVQTAQSGIALAIKFMPTLAKIEERDHAGVEGLKQLFHDWKTWWEVYENQLLDGEIDVTIGDKLPTNRTERINELNNMLDRKVISKKYYREEMQQLGYEFPDNIQDEIDKEIEKEAEQKAAMAPAPLQQNAKDAATGAIPPPPGQKASTSNNAASGKVNESKGTEATSGKKGGRPQ